MKARLAFLSIALCLCLLAGWGVSGVEKPLQEEAPPEESQVTTFCRVVQEEQGTLLLAEQGSTAVFTLTLGDQDMTLDGASFDPSAPGAYQALPGESLAGTTVLVTHSGGFQETWPLRFSNVTALAFSIEEFNDLGALYLQVLEDLWAVDPGLNENITELGVDLSGTSLSYTEQQAVAWAFGQAHGLPVIQGTYEELAEGGYLTLVSLGDSDGAGEEDPALYQWEDGCLFSITETDDPVVFSLPSLGPGDEIPDYDGVGFNAEKWRSPLGAYYFQDCTAVSTGGHWGSYTIGSEAIS